VRLPFELDACAITGDFGASQTFPMKVCPFERKVSFGADHESASFFFIAAASGTLTGPATTAYQPFVVDITAEGSAWLPKRLAIPMASSTF
jgi:hypothetical protein